MSNSLQPPWTGAYQAPLSMGFSRQEYWSGVPLPSPWALAITLERGSFLSLEAAYQGPFPPVQILLLLIELLYGEKHKTVPRRFDTEYDLTMLKPLTVWITTNCGKFWEMGLPDHLPCPLRNLHAGQEATVRTWHGTTDWFQIGKGVHQGCILSLCCLNHQGSH